VAENATAYRAKWVALKAGSLVASGSSLDALKQELQSRVDHAELTLMQVPT
jgi:ABC-type hemin transport system ATPase subunit